MDVDLKCPCCELLFRDIKSLMYHFNVRSRNVHPNGKVLKCPRCPKEYERRYLLIRHIKNTCFKQELQEEEVYVAPFQINPEPNSIMEDNPEPNPIMEDDVISETNDNQQLENQVFEGLSTPTAEEIEGFIVDDLVEAQVLLQIEHSVPRRAINEIFSKLIPILRDGVTRKDVNQRRLAEKIDLVTKSDHRRKKWISERWTPNKVHVETVKLDPSDPKSWLKGYYILPSQAIKKIANHPIWSRRLLKSFERKLLISIT